MDAIIMGVDEHQHANPGPMGRTVLDVMRKAACEVILDKVQTEAAPRSQSHRLPGWKGVPGRPCLVERGDRGLGPPSALARR